MNWLIDWLRRLFGGGDPPGPPPPSGDVGAEMLALHNRERTIPLQLDPRLMRAAHQHAEWMDSTKLLTHQGLLERGVGAGYTGRLVENIAMNGSAAEVFAMWMNSAAHRRNALDGAYHHAGFASVGNYFCAIYGGD